MHATEVIERYVDDTVRLLPKRQRDDVATELRALLEARATLYAEAEHIVDTSGRKLDVLVEEPGDFRTGKVIHRDLHCACRPCACRPWAC